jgi:hypothetical protein
MRRRMQRVERFGPVDCDGEHRPIARHAAVLEVFHAANTISSRRFAAFCFGTATMRARKPRPGAGRFPDDEHSYTMKDVEYEKFLRLVEKRKHV